MFSLNPQQQATISDLLSRLSDNTATALDPSDARARSAIQVFLDLSNKGSDRYPALNAALNASGGAVGNGSTPLDRPSVVDLGQDSGGRATSRTWIGSPGRPLLSGAATLVLDSESSTPLAFGTATRVGESLVQVSTNTATAQQATGRMTALTIHHVQDAPDVAPRFTAVSRTLDTVDDAPNINVTAPVTSTHAQVCIGLNRTQPQPDCDYSFVDPNPVAEPILLVPFTGSATLPASITGIGQDGQISGLTVSSVIFVQLSLSSPSNPTSPGTLAHNVTANASQPTILNWSFPPTSASTAINYSPAAAALDTVSAFLFQFNVPVNAPNSTYQFAVCSKSTPNQPSIVCKEIDNVKFVWHCLAGDTLIVRADGSTMALKDVDNTVRVRTGIGEGTLAVGATWRGRHTSTGAEQAVHIVTSEGQSLIATAAHPIMTPIGLIAAGDLQAGQCVMTAGGAAATLTRVERVSYDGDMWNVKLGDTADRRGGYSAASVGTFTANGIVVGDFEAQGAMYRLTRRSLDYMTGWLPASHHRDYASALEDSRQP